MVWADRVRTIQVLAEADGGHRRGGGAGGAERRRGGRGEAAAPDCQGQPAAHQGRRLIWHLLYLFLLQLFCFCLLSASASASATPLLLRLVLCRLLCVFDIRVDSASRASIAANRSAPRQPPRRNPAPRPHPLPTSSWPGYAGLASSRSRRPRLCISYSSIPRTPSRPQIILKTSRFTGTSPTGQCARSCMDDKRRV